MLRLHLGIPHRELPRRLWFGFYNMPRLLWHLSHLILYFAVNVFFPKRSNSQIWPAMLLMIRTFIMWSSRFTGTYSIDASSEAQASFSLADQTSYISTLSLCRPVLDPVMSSTLVNSELSRVRDYS